MSPRAVQYVARRLLLTALGVFVVATAVYFAVRVLPGTAFMSDRFGERQADALIRYYGLDRPVLEQYWSWLSGIAVGDLGESLVVRGEAIAPRLASRLVVSLQLGLGGMAVGLLVGLSLGTIAAIRAGSRLDTSLSSIAIVLYTIPSFVLASVLIMLGSQWLYTLTEGRFFLQIGWGDPTQILLPAIALGLPAAGIIARQTRAGLRDVARMDYIRTAQAKGVSDLRVLTHHQLRTGLIPVVTILGPLTAEVLTGSLVIEGIFGIPGLGELFVDSILGRDYNVTVAVFSLFAALVGLANVLVDLSYVVLDPRIRL